MKSISPTIMNKKCGIGIVVFVLFCVILGVLLGILLPRSESDEFYIQDLPESSPWYGNEDIKLYRQYLRIPSVHPNIDYEPCVRLLKKAASNLGLDVSVYYPVNEQNPVVVLTWLGSEPNLPSIMLNSHMDVVPVFEEFWTHPPFAADVDDDGKIFARGSQDAKSSGMLQLSAIKALKQDGINQLKRTFHVTFVPDEEMGGLQGMAAFVLTDNFKNLNVGYALDEASVSEGAQIGVYNDERCTWRIEFICKGVTGHGSILFENTAGEKLNYLIGKLMERRKSEQQRMKDLNLPYGNVTSINLTMLKGGVQANVIPPELSAVFDIRLAVDADHEAFENDLNQWCAQAGGGIDIKYAIKDPKATLTHADETNPLWAALQKTGRELGLQIVPEVSTAATDARYLRRINIPVFGFLPVINNTRLPHDHNEYIQADEFLAGIKRKSHLNALTLTHVDETKPLWTPLQKTERGDVVVNITKKVLGTNLFLAGLQIVPVVPTGGTDARFLRRINIPVFGFLPVINSTKLLHDHNEYIQVDEFLAGIKVYKQLISNLGDI